jgi:hypothetical protein
MIYNAPLYHPQLKVFSARSKDIKFEYPLKNISLKISCISQMGPNKIGKIKLPTSKTANNLFESSILQSFSTLLAKAVIK